MVSEAWIPDFVIGVDFGMTCTGVAYSYAPDWPSPKPLQHWPGLARTELANKVPSQLVYHVHSNVVRSWGFQCDSERGNVDFDIKEDFKLNLDPHFKDSRQDAPSCENAMQWFQDYILVIYRYTISHLAQGFPRFNSRRVEFIFSVPTTWKDPRMVARLRDSITLSSPLHRAKIGLTEAEAAAVYASGHFYQKGDVILICDAGGGTMDVNILKFLSAPGEATNFCPLGLVEGEPSGSVMIDIGAHQMLCEKLNMIRDSLPHSARKIAREMMENGFEQFKCSFGAAGHGRPKPLELFIPGFNEKSNFPGASIVEGHLTMSQEELRALFDLRFQEMQGLLDDQISQLQRSHPLEQISFIVLSGGFGSSPYIRQKLKQRYEDPYNMSTPIQVLTVDEPQLAVVQGQVMNRIQQLKQGSYTLQSLLSRVSYGVICDQPYDPSRHTGETVRNDKWDKKMYATQQIDWLVRQGDMVPRVGVTQVFRRKIPPENTNKPWMAQIVMSTLPQHQLPRSMSCPGARLICNIRVDMSSVDQIPKHNRWYDFRPKYYVAVINFRVVVGPTDLQFELWNMNGRKIRGETHDPVIVKWEPVVEKMDDKGEARKAVLEKMDDRREGTKGEPPSEMPG